MAKKRVVKKKALVKKGSNGKKTIGRKTTDRRTDTEVKKRRELIEIDLIEGDGRAFILAKKYGVHVTTIHKDMTHIQNSWARSNNGELDAKRVRRVSQLEHTVALALKEFKESQKVGSKTSKTTSSNDKGDFVAVTENTQYGDASFLRVAQDGIDKIAKLEGLHVEKKKVEIEGRFDIQTMAIQMAQIPDKELDKIVEAAEKLEELSGSQLLLESEIEE